MRAWSWVSWGLFSALSFAWGLGRLGPHAWRLVGLVSYAPPVVYVAPALGLLLLTVVARAWGAVAIAGLGVLVAVFPLGGFAIPRPNTRAPSSATVRIMTYNVEKWESGGPALARTIASADPDVVCFQEAGKYAWQTEPAMQPEALARALPGYRFVGEGELLVGSRWPLSDLHTVPLAPGPLRRPLVDVVATAPGGQRFHVVTVHLIPTLLGVPEASDRGAAAKGGLADVLEVRQEQAERLAAYVHALTGPVIVCGDFNTPPRTAAMRRVKSELTDAWASRGLGFGFSEKTELPRERFDYVLARGLEVLDVRVGTARTSDHFPVIAELGLEVPAGSR